MSALEISHIMSSPNDNAIKNFKMLKEMLNSRTTESRKNSEKPLYSWQTKRVAISNNSIENFKVP